MREGWVYKKLGEVCETSSGGTPSKSHMEYYDGGKIPWLRSGEVSQGLIYDTELCITELGLVKSSAKIFPINTVVIAMYGATVGQVGLLKREMSTNQAICGIFPNSIIFPMFLLYILKSKKSLFLKDAVGGAQPNISQNIIKNTIIPIPPLSEQERIVSELDLLSSIIEKKKAQLKEYDQLAQSIFYDMFGDPVTNEKGWEVKQLKDVTIKMGSGATPRGGNQSYKTEGISLIRSLNVHNGSFKYEDLAHIDITQAEQLNNVEVEKNDVLLNITGASVARCCVVPSNVLPARVNQHVSILRPDCKKLDYSFLCRLLISDKSQYELLLLSKSNGATREALPKSILEKFQIPLPPLPLQQSFASKIEAIERQKALVQQSITEAETLFNSRMDYWFS